MGKNPPANGGTAGDVGSIPGLGRPPLSGKWQPTPIFLPGKFHGQRRLAGYGPGGCQESDTTERAEARGREQQLEGEETGVEGGGLETQGRNSSGFWMEEGQVQAHRQREQRGKGERASEPTEGQFVWGEVAEKQEENLQ